MKIRTSLLGALTLLTGLSASAQGTLTYDQQSSTDETPPTFGAGSLVPVNPGTGTGQSFTPSLSSVGFIRLMLDDADPTDGAGATVYINLRSGSILGPIIGTTASVRMLNTFSGPATFLFASPVPLAPATTYYFEAVEQTGGSWDMYGVGSTYAGGSGFSAGVPTAGNLWFREGTIVPEPSSAALLLLGGAALASLRRGSRK